MKIAIVGYGNMGQLIQRLAQEQGHSCVSIDPQVAQADYDSLENAPISDQDVCIDFTAPQVFVKNIEFLSRSSARVVVGTTGWYGQEEELRKLVEQNEMGFLYASNFSVGMYLFSHVLRSAAKAFNAFSEYDVAASEQHHRGKLDSPSGTALSLGQILLDNIDRKTELQTARLDRRPEPNELHFSSVRCGSIPGTHEVFFDSQADSISLRHSARSREGFAFGALRAAQWLSTRRGFFTFDDFMQDLLNTGEQ